MEEGKWAMEEGKMEGNEEGVKRKIGEVMKDIDMKEEKQRL